GKVAGAGGGATNGSRECPRIGWTTCVRSTARLGRITPTRGRSARGERRREDVARAGRARAVARFLEVADAGSGAADHTGVCGRMLGFCACSVASYHGSTVSL